MPTYSFDLNLTESVFSIVKGSPLKSPGSIRECFGRSKSSSGTVILFNLYSKICSFQRGYHHTRRLSK